MLLNDSSYGYLITYQQGLNPLESGRVVKFNSRCVIYDNGAVLIPLNRVVLLNMRSYIDEELIGNSLNPLESGRVVKS